MWTSAASSRTVLLTAVIAAYITWSSAVQDQPAITMYDSHHRLHHPLVDGSVISCDNSQKAHILVSLSPRPPSRAQWKLSVALNQSGIV